jgi:hypothetical protein
VEGWAERRIPPRHFLGLLPQRAVVGGAPLYGYCVAVVSSFYAVPVPSCQPWSVGNGGHPPIHVPRNWCLSVIPFPAIPFRISFVSFGYGVWVAAGGRVVILLGVKRYRRTLDQDPRIPDRSTASSGCQYALRQASNDKCRCDPGSLLRSWVKIRKRISESVTLISPDPQRPIMRPPTPWARRHCPPAEDRQKSERFSTLPKHSSKDQEIFCR